MLFWLLEDIMAIVFPEAVRPKYKVYWQEPNHPKPVSAPLSLLPQLL
jgi:hypothetical protein